MRRSLQTVIPARLITSEGWCAPTRDDTEGAITDLKKAVELEKDSDTGKAAQAALTQLGATP